MKRSMVPPYRAYAAAVVVGPAAALATIVPFRMLWGPDVRAGVLSRAWWAPGTFGLPLVNSRLLVTCILLAGILVHELIHALGFRVFARIPWTHIELTVRWRALLVVCHTTGAVSLAAYRKVLILPAVILGGVPGIIGVAIGSPKLVWFGFMMLVVAAGDFAALWTLWRARHPKSK